MNNPKPENALPTATPEDVHRLLGDLDTSTVTAIMALAPTLAEIEEAALWVAGEGETMPERHQPHGAVEAILDLVAAEDAEERRE